MNRDAFLDHLRSGRPITPVVAEVTGDHPSIMTIAEEESSDRYVRYGVMMSAGIIAALVTLDVETDRIPPHRMTAIKNGEPIGLVLDGMKRIGSLVLPYPRGVRSCAALWWDGHTVGEAQEVYTVSLLQMLQEPTAGTGSPTA